jgi:hypothetical protein
MTSLSNDWSQHPGSQSQARRARLIAHPNAMISTASVLKVVISLRLCESGRKETVMKASFVALFALFVLY